MEDLKSLSVYDLAVKLNRIIKIKGSAAYFDLTPLELIEIDTEWNDVVLELWERIPSLKDDPDIRPVVTDISTLVKKKLPDKY